MTSFWEILKSSKNLKASDAFAELWGKSIADSWDIITITGTLPLTFEAKGEALKNYRLYGTSEGAGVQTVNLVDKDNLNIVKAYINSNDTIVSYNTNGLIYVPVVTGETYTISGFKRSTSATDIKWGITASIPTNNVSCTRVGLLNQSSSITVTITSGEAYLCIFLCGDSEYSQYGSVEQAVMKNAETGMIIPGSTAPETYIPYGYQIPITLTSGQNTDTYPLYIGSTQLGAEEYVDYAEQKIWKMVDGTLTPTDPPAPFPTITAYKGENTLNSTEAVGEVSVTGKIKEI